MRSLEIWILACFLNSLLVFRILVTISSIQSTGQAGIHNLHPGHSVTNTVCIKLFAPIIASKGHAFIQRVHPIQSDSLICATYPLPALDCTACWPCVVWLQAGTDISTFCFQQVQMMADYPEVFQVGRAWIDRFIPGIFNPRSSPNPASNQGVKKNPDPITSITITRKVLKQLLAAWHPMCVHVTNITLLLFSLCHPLAHRYSPIRLSLSVRVQ